MFDTHLDKNPEVSPYSQGMIGLGVVIASGYAAKSSYEIAKHDRRECEFSLSIDPSDFSERS